MSSRDGDMTDLQIIIQPPLSDGVTHLFSEVTSPPKMTMCLLSKPSTFFNVFSETFHSNSLFFPKVKSNVSPPQ